MSRATFWPLTLIALGAFSALPVHASDVPTPQPDGMPSIIELFAHPESFAGHRILVSGFVNFELEGDGLYLSKQDYDFGLFQNALWVDVREGITLSPKCQKRYVMLEGTYDPTSHGAYGFFRGGALRDVSECKILSPRPLTRRSSGRIAASGSGLRPAAAAQLGR